MRIGKQLLVAFGALAMGLGGIAVSAEAKVRHCTTEACACEQALKQNSVEALEAYLRKYPESTEGKASVCSAFAVPPSDDMPADQGSGDARMPAEPSPFALQG